MKVNYTPLKIKNGQEGDNTNTILLLIATLTAAVLAIMLFILIQKRLSYNIYNEKLILITTNQY